DLPLSPRPGRRGRNPRNPAGARRRGHDRARPLRALRRGHQERVRTGRPPTHAPEYAAGVNPERARELLARERERIERELAGLAPRTSDEPTTDQHLADQASDLYDAELDEGLSDDLRAALAAVERAEERLAKGTYGLSIESGDPIPDERLEAVPTAERTVAEQARYEAGARNASGRRPEP